MEALGAAQARIWRYWVQLAAQPKIMARKYGGTGCSSTQNMEALGATAAADTVNMEALGATEILINFKNQSLNIKAARLILLSSNCLLARLLPFLSWRTAAFHGAIAVDDYDKVVISM
jgi:phage/plasmid-associated DNA primase